MASQSRITTHHLQRRIDKCSLTLWKEGLRRDMGGGCGGGGRAQIRRHTGTLFVRIMPSDEISTRINEKERNEEKNEAGKPENSSTRDRCPPCKNSFSFSFRRPSKKRSGWSEVRT
jgi:hypothetical protein